MTPEFSSSAGQKPKLWWFAFIVAVVLVMAAAPFGLDVARVFDITLIFIFGILALSMGFLWGYVGILSFGQTVFFGIGGYAYTIFLMNTDLSTVAFAIGILVSVPVAAILGYFMIYGQISDIYLSVITLVVTLIFDKSMRATSGPEYVIGTVRLNGQNGIPGIPPLVLPFADGAPISMENMFYLAGGLLVVVYVGLRLLLTTRFGRVLVGIRENERRMELLGYDTRRFKLAAFVLAGAVASLAGVLFAAWGSFVGPDMFNLNQAAQIVIWVIVGGRSTLIGPIFGAAMVQYLSNWLGTVGLGQVSLVLGIVLICFVLLFPRGLVPTLGDLGRRLLPRSRASRQGSTR